jgi:hypothetical protein
MQHDDDAMLMCSGTAQAQPLLMAEDGHSFWGVYADKEPDKDKFVCKCCNETYSGGLSSASHGTLVASNEVRPHHVELSRSQGDLGSRSKSEEWPTAKSGPPLDGVS